VLERPPVQFPLELLVVPVYLRRLVGGGGVLVGYVYVYAGVGTAVNPCRSAQMGFESGRAVPVLWVLKETEVLDLELYTPVRIPDSTGFQEPVYTVME